MILIALGVIVSIMIIVLLYYPDKSVNDDSARKNKWQAAYYPDGCLDCQKNYIFSPFYDNVNECINWVHEKATSRKNKKDAAECSYNCRTEYLGNNSIFVCTETVDVLGKPSL